MVFKYNNNRYVSILYAVIIIYRKSNKKQQKNTRFD
jgi:hypothetical protein